MLDVPLRDVTGGYRAFRRETLEGLGMEEVASQGYCFQVDLAWRAVKAGFHVVEVPITFVERERGDSKMSRNIVAEALLRVTAWGVSSRVESVLGRDSRDAGAARAAREASTAELPASRADQDGAPAPAQDSAPAPEDSGEAARSGGGGSAGGDGRG
jgi:dolichol-phosphate mannosyltransferase